jgi:hypothetical protein
MGHRSIFCTVQCGKGNQTRTCVSLSVKIDYLQVYVPLNNFSLIYVTIACDSSHSRCSTIEIPPCSDVLSAKHRSKFCSPSPPMVTSPYARSGVYQMWILKNSKELANIKAQNFSQINSIKT